MRYNITTDIPEEVNRLKIAVCDDERVIREQLSELIERQMPDCKIDSYSSGEQLLAAKSRYSMIFLDIQMEGRNGIETARILRERGDGAILIFITAIREYVFEAFDVAAFHYLIKPIAEEKFAEVFQRAAKEVRKAQGEAPETIFIKTRNRNIRLDKRKIFYIESRTRKAAIHTGREVLEIYATMNGLAEQLGDDFYRCHRGYLVNLACIREYNSDSIVLCNGETLYLAKEKYSEFVKRYMRYLRDGGTACV